MTAVPPPEPKRVTDEELAQKYGIHLATRLHSDGADKQATWADIDDDEDDWQPEAIEWADGTKAPLPSHDSPRPEPAKPAAPSTAPAPAAPDNKPPPTVLQPPKNDKPASPGPSMTSSLKLGGGKGLVLKGGGLEKLTLVAKPPAPQAAVKSPWAPLPHVDKTAPIITELPQRQQQRYNNRSNYEAGRDRMPPPPEIAADDFSRGWREGQHGGNRELYNSQSGRYEPVGDGRRGSRNDMHAGPPHLMQRRYEMQGPAEPSSAFQTHRDHATDLSYGRRRTSSNVSGASGLYGRRLSRGQEGYPPHDIPDGRRGSYVHGGPESLRGQSPGGQLRQNYPPPPSQVQARASPVAAHSSMVPGHSPLATAPPVQAPAAPLIDEVELQKKIMKDGRELARKRRLEQEAKEEAERKERIRLKLEAMGPPPEKKKPETPKEEKAVPTQIQTRDSPPKPPANDESGEVKQYGVMKVHPPGRVQSHASAAEQGFSRQEPPQTRDDMQTSGRRLSAHGGPEKEPDQEHLLHNSQPSSPGRVTNWTSSGQHQNQNRSVWGPPTADRTLGNGTFNPELSTQAAQMAQGGPGPIGSPLNNRGNGQYPSRPREPYGQRPAPIGPPSRQQEQRQTSGAAPGGWTAALSTRTPEDDVRRRMEGERELLTRPGEQQTAFKETWRPAHIGEDGRRVSSGPTQVIMDRPAVNATNWDYTGRPRQEDIPPHTSIEHGVSPQQPWAQSSLQDVTSMAPLPSRGSRFFPQARNVSREMPAPEPYTRSGSPSPPPPTMWGHPAYDGDARHPQVSLPRTPPVVRLPPAPVLAPIAPPKPVSFAQAAAAAAVTPTGPRTPPVAIPLQRGASSTGEFTGGWQDKINNLMGRKASPPKTHALAVNSSSKYALDQSVSQVPAISFPGFSGRSDHGEIESKPMAEECFEEQEMGFVPVVKVPRDAPKNAYDFCSAPKPLHRKFWVNDAVSAYEVGQPAVYLRDRQAEVINVRFPGMSEEDAKTVLREVGKRPSYNRPGRGRGAGPRNPSTYTRGGRGRGDNLGPNNGGSPAQDGSAPSTPGATQRGGRGRGGFGGASWTSRHGTPPSAVNANA